MALFLTQRFILDTFNRSPRPMLRASDKVPERRRPRRLQAWERRKGAFSSRNAGGLSRRGRQRSRLHLSFGFGMNPARGPDAFPLSIHEPGFLINPYGQSLWQA